MATKRKVRIANPIAERRFSIAGEPGREIVLILGKPRPEPDPSVWMCSFLIEGLPSARRVIARGVDSLQAVQNAINAARYRLRQSGLVLTAPGSMTGDTGLPYPIPHYEGSDFAERMERYVTREEKKLIRNKVRRDKRRGGR